MNRPPTSLRGLHVLVVDDEPNIRHSIQQALQRAGAESKVAADAPEAAQRIADEAFDVLLLDLRLTGMSGLELIDELQHAAPALPIVVFSAHASPEVAAEAIRRGAADFLEKPVSPDRVRQAVLRAASEHWEERGSPAATSPQAREDSSPVVVVASDESAVDGLLHIGSAMAAKANPDQMIAVCPVEVPFQLSLRQATYWDKASVSWQADMMDAVDRASEELSLDVRKKTIWTHNAVDALLSFIDAQQASHLLLSWEGNEEAARRLSAAAVQRLARRAETNVTLVKQAEGFAPREIVALVQEGTDAVWAVRRAWALARHAGVARLTILHARTPSTADEADAPEDDLEAGYRLLDRVLNEANVPAEKVDTVVLVDDSPLEALRQTLAAFDTLCLGSNKQSGMARCLFGSLTDEVAAQYEGTVLIAQGPPDDTPSVIHTLLDRMT